ncbi:hypothetical protein BDZ89DRAFT_902812, partial [Hymenopellis radicata]
VIQSVVQALMKYITPYYWKQDYHTSRMKGDEWVQELKDGHPDRIHTELGMRLHVFLAFIIELRLLGLEDTRNITLDESAAIFLY